MSNSGKKRPELNGAPEPEFRTKKRRISIVWLVPLIALAIGGWLVYKAISEKGRDTTLVCITRGLWVSSTSVRRQSVSFGMRLAVETTTSSTASIRVSLSPPQPRATVTCHCHSTHRSFFPHGRQATSTVISVATWGKFQESRLRFSLSVK